MYRIYLLILILLTGCASIGPTNVDIDRSRYNDIIEETDLEQQLKNIVRLRYAQNSSYFQVNNVIASYSLVSDLSVQGANRVYDEQYGQAKSITPTLVYADSPTISYTPIQGTEFINSLASSVPYDYFIILSRGGSFSFSLLSKLMLAQIGNLKNSPSAVTISVKKIPQYEEFYHFVDVIEEMLINKTAIPSPVYFNKKYGLMLTFTQKDSADALWIKKVMGVSAQSEDIIFMPEPEALSVKENQGFLTMPGNTHYKNVVFVKTRSVDSMLIFLSHGVQIPPSVISSHVTIEKYNQDGSVYDWTPLMKNIITIYSSDFRPFGDVFIKTFVNNRWYYIKASDLNSKATFFILIKLSQMVSVMPANVATPALTLAS